MPPCRVQLTRTHRVLIAVVVLGAVIVAAIGFAGSYTAVRELAAKKGFHNFSYLFPIGIDAGICVLLALDLLLTWIRIPFPLLRQTAWLLTIATIAFNAAAASDPLGMGMHAVIPVLFVVTVEAARHTVGRIADLTADKHMEGVRLTRWLLAPLPTFLLWRRMKLWELRSYDQVIKLEQDRLVYQARLQSRFGRGWRRKAPVESLMPLRLARYGVPLAETAPAGLAAAGIDNHLLPTAERTAIDPAPEPEAIVGSGTSTPSPADEAGPAAAETEGETTRPDPHPPEDETASPNPEREDPAPTGAGEAPATQDGRPDADVGEDDEREPDPTDDRDDEGDQAREDGGADGSGGEDGNDQNRADTTDHTKVIASMKNADAVRYAITQLATYDAPALSRWLKEHGKNVNGGQIWRIANSASKRAATEPAQSTLEKVKESESAAA
uniref:Putative membrane protein n=1 Tax=Streptomyces sp. FR1 TaxID=349971 RepID=V9Z654_9ACTN|nr:Putative membrane protein [Streptomyces sp. FR1]